MLLEQFVSAAWRDHGTRPEEVAQRLSGAVSWITKDDDSSKLVSLAAHVWGEHLGRWDEGIDFFRKLAEHTDEAKVAYAIAGLELAAGRRQSLEALTPSDQIKALCVASASLIEHDGATPASEFFHQAVGLAAELQKTDPTNRTIAVTANNMASSLEQDEQRSAEATGLMLRCAETARKFWEIAGTWLEVERAEYRLAMSCLKANDANRALIHANLCLGICERNQASALEMFFAYEAIALAERARGNVNGFTDARKQVEKYFLALDLDDKSWCEATLSSLRLLS